MNKIIPLTVLIIALHGLSCNKFSNQLPEPEIEDPSFRISKVMSQPDFKIEATFFQHKVRSQDSIYMKLESDRDIAINLVVEVCESEENYDECSVVFNEPIEVKKSDTTNSFFIGKSTSLPFDLSNYHIYITGYDSTSAFASGYYENLSSLMLIDDSTVSYPYVFGFVEVDGYSTFRMKVGSDDFFNIENGQFFDSTFFSGQVVSDNLIQSQLSLVDTLRFYNSNSVLSLLLSMERPLSNGVNNINLNLRKE